MNILPLNLNKVLIFLGIVVFGFIVVFLFWWNNEFEIDNGLKIIKEEESPKSSIAGLECLNFDRRPMAVMISSDVETRPLSGIGQADLVFEMPVAPNGITRLMAVFQCEDPPEIGSVRSSREDFIPLAASLGSIYAHWGGEKEALKKLDNGIMDNVDALRYEGTVFYRKPKIKAPHNGFTSMSFLWGKASDLDYDRKDDFTGYKRQKNAPKKNLSNLVDSVIVDYPAPYNVLWTYDQESNDYSRFRAGTPEIDKNFNSQIKAKVVIVMDTTSRILNSDYIRIDVQGEGDVRIFQNGTAINGKWKKDPLTVESKLLFYHESGEEIEFASGKIWVEIMSTKK